MPMDARWCLVHHQRDYLRVTGLPKLTHSHTEEESIPWQKPNRTTLPRPPLCVPGAALSSPDLCCYLLLLMENFMKQRLNFTTKPKRVEASAPSRGEKKKKRKEKKRKEDDAITKRTWTGCNSDRLQPQVNQQLIRVAKHGQTGCTSS